MASYSDLRIEPLCSHHDLDHFKCGQRLRDLAARNLAKRVRNLDSYDFSAIVAVRSEGRVVGIASVVDLDLAGDRDDAGAEVSGLCLFYSLLATGVDVQSDVTVVERLLVGLAVVRDHIYGRSPNYIAEIAAPPPDATALIFWLETHGFRRLDTAWYRPRGDVDPNWP